ncbi:hypothetical protein [Chryseobacterium sp. IT-36CA2]|uniref:hypothetical protein n=1 Tax=Chryseobacterium sp. IT-36CA2 TaxID=3026460 RepID=UPI0039DFDC7B
MSYEDHWWSKSTRYIYNYGLGLFNIIIGILYALIGILFGINKEIFGKKIHSYTLGWVLLCIALILSLIQFFKQNKKDKSILNLEKINNSQSENIQKLENQIQKINQNSIDIVEIHLAYLFVKLGLGDNERISIYKFINDQFYVLGRYSSNPELKTKSRRNYKKEGLINKAWELKKYFKNNGIPLPDKNRTKFRRGYYKILNDIAPIEEETVWKMKMKSRSFYLRAFDDLNELARTSIIVIESKNDNAFQESDIDDKLSIEEEKKLVAFVEKIDWNFPNIENAEQNGF